MANVAEIRSKLFARTGTSVEERGGKLYTWIDDPSGEGGDDELDAFVELLGELDIEHSTVDYTGRSNRNDRDEVSSEVRITLAHMRDAVDVTVTVPANPDLDDCLAAAAAAYIEEHPELEGYDLEPRWSDDDSRETVDLTVPAWAADDADLVLCESPDGWSLHAPGSTDEQIASGDARYLVSGTGEPSEADYAQAWRVLASRGVAS